MNNDYTTENFLKRLIKNNPKIKTIIVHQTESSKVVQIFSEKERGKMGNIIFTSKLIDSELHCGVIDQMAAKSLNNLESYIEGLEYNSCLNRKIGVDVNGEIKNCPSMKESFGNIEVSSLRKIVLGESFQKKWFLSKDKISVCKACEFRRICSDCRAYTENDEILGKPKKCNYDPYTATWS
jgi:SPASM domain peptide maturase of grasp-with-spasm system